MRTVFMLDDRRASELLAAGLTITEAARALGVSRQALYDAIRKGRVERPAVATGGRSE